MKNNRRPRVKKKERTISIIEAIDIFLMYKKNVKRVRPDTIRYYTEHINILKRFFDYKNIKNISEITYLLLDEYTEHELIRGCSHNTISKRISICKDILHVLVLRKIIITNPINDYFVEQDDPKHFEIVENELLVKVFEYLKSLDNHWTNERLKLCIYISLECGIRQAELLRLNFGDIKENSIVLSKEQSKTGRKREISITDNVMLQLYAYKEAIEKIVGIGLIKNTTPLFISSKNIHSLQRMNRNGISGIMNKLSKSIGLENNITTHQLRKSFATNAEMHGVELSIISSELGHSNLKTTTIYLRHGRKHIDTRKNESSLLKQLLV